MTTKTRQYFNSWGTHSENMPSYAVRDEDTDPIDAVCSAIERKTGLSVYTCYTDSRSAESTTYQLSLVDKSNWCAGSTYVSIDHDSSE